MANESLQTKLTEKIKQMTIVNSFNLFFFMFLSLKILIPLFLMVPHLLTMIHNGLFYLFFLIGSFIKII